MPRSAAGNVTKGKVFEREICAHLATIGLDAHRTVATQQAGDRSRGHADIVGMPGVAPELKRTERFDLEGSLSQAIRNAQSGEVPIVITRRNRVATGDSRVVIRFDDFLKFYAAWLRQEGYLR